AAPGRPFRYVGPFPSYLAMILDRPVRHRTDSPRLGEFVHRQTWRVRTARRVTTHCHLSQPSDRSRPVILLFADRATQNAHRRWPPPRLTALQLLLWFS